MKKPLTYGLTGLLSIALLGFKFLAKKEAMSIASTLVCVEAFSQTGYPTTGQNNTAGVWAGYYVFSGTGLSNGIHWMRITRDTLEPMHIMPKAGLIFDSINKQGTVSSTDSIFVIKNRKMRFIHRDSLKWSISQITGLEEWVSEDALTWSDTIPGDIMTTYAAETAISALDAQIDDKVGISDTADMLEPYETIVHAESTYEPLLGFIPYNSSNPAGYISSVPAQSFSSLTGKPTTLSGYGITDAYPLTGNPSGFLTSITSGQVISALGYTPYNATNPNAYISDLSTFTTTNLAEGSNEYFTISRARLSVSAGTGIGYNSSTGLISNAAPDQTVVLTNGTNISVSGTYPNFTINSTALSLPSLGSPNQLLRVNSGGSSAEWFTPSFLTANQNITLSGDVTGSGSTAITTTLSNSGVTAGTYRAGVTVDVKGRVTDGLNPTVNNAVSRSISNGAGSTNRYTISTTRPCFVTYSITMNFTVTALLSSSATVFLEYSTDGGTVWSLVSQVNTSFGLGLALSGSNDMSLSGYIPANALIRLRPATTNATVSYVTGQEVLY